ncbi:MAG: LysR family transcriptional regulator [Caulobacteraceae bacterium]
MDDPASLLSIELRTALVVAETASFSRAGRQLGVQQSTVSRRVRDLEDRVGVSLFERYSHGVRLTGAGSAFLDHASRTRDTLATALAEARDAGAAQTGRLRLGFVWSFTAGVAREIVASFRTQNPGVRLQLTELGAAELLKRTLARQIDCAWIVRWRDLDPALEVEPLWSEALHLAASAAKALTDPQDWDVLGREPYVCRASEEWRNFQSHLDAIDGPKMDIHAHDCSQESLLSLVAAGDGITILCESIAGLGHPGVTFAPMSDPRARLEICVIWRRETDNPALRRFLALSRSWLSEHRPAPPATSASG